MSNQCGPLRGARPVQFVKACIILCLMAGRALAQTSFPGILDQLKAETIRRTEESQYPMVGYTVADIKDALSGVKSKAEDDWAAGFMRVADRYTEKAKQEEKTDGRAALNDYSIAHRYYYMARWPTPTTPVKRTAFQKSLESFFAWDKLTECRPKA